MCVTDLETTGTNPQKHEIIQVGRVLVDLVERRIVPDTLLTAYILPQAWETRDRKAMRVNKISKATLDGFGVTPVQGLLDFGRDVPWGETQLAAWGTDFEMSFLGAAFSKVDRMNPIPYRSQDIRSWAFFARDGYDCLGLGDSCVEAGIPFDPALAHDAGYDALKTAEIALNLLDRRRDV